MAHRDLSAAKLAKERAKMLEDFLELVNSSDTNEAYQGMTMLVKKSIRKYASHENASASPENVLVDLYLASSPQCSELFSWWDGLIQGKVRPQKGKEGAFSAALLDAFATVLHDPESQNIDSDKKDSSGGKNVSVFAATRQIVVKRILVDKMGFIGQFLGSTRDHNLVKALLKLLTGIAGCGAAACRVLSHKLRLDSPHLLRCVDRLNSNKDGAAVTNNRARFGSARHRCLQLVAALLGNADVNVKKRLIEPKGLAQTALKMIVGDPIDMARPLLHSIRENVLRDPKVGRKAQIAFFHPETALSHGIMSLYAATEAEMRELGHAMLRELFFDKHHAVFPLVGGDRMQHMEPNTRRCVSVLLQALSPVEDALQRELLFDVLKAAGPVAVEDFLKGGFGRLSLEPRSSFKWVKNVGFCSNVLRLPMGNESLLVTKVGLNTANNINSELSLAQWELMGGAFLARTLPRELTLSKATLSKGVQHKSSLVVVQSLDLLMQLLARVDAQLVIERTAATKQFGSRQLTAAVDAQVPKWLAQRLPHVSVVVALLRTEDHDVATDDGSGVCKKADNVASQWNEAERVWVRLRASRALLWYAKVMPAAIVTAKLDLAKLLTTLYSETGAQKEEANKLERNRLLTQVSLVQCIAHVPLSASRWNDEQNLVRLLAVRGRAAGLKLRPNAEAVVLGDIDDVLVPALLALAGVSDTNEDSSASSCVTSLDGARQYAMALLSLVRSDADATRIARVVLGASTLSPTTPSGVKLLQSAFMLPNQPGEKAPIAVVLVLELLHSLMQPAAIFVHAVQNALFELSELGPAVLRYAKDILGLEIDTSAFAGMAVQKGALQKFGTILGLQRGVIGLSIGCLAPFAPNGGGPLFSAKLIKAHSDKLFAQARVASEAHASRASKLLSRLVATKLRSESTTELDAGITLCFDVLDVLVERHPIAVARNTLWFGPTVEGEGDFVVDRARILSVPALKRMAKIFNQAACQNGKNSNASRDVTLQQRRMVVSLLEAICKINIETKDGRTFRALLAEVLLCGQRCLIQELRSGQLAVGGPLLGRLCNGFAHQNHMLQSLCLLILRTVEPSIVSMATLLQLAKDCPGTDVDRALFYVCTALCGEHIDADDSDDDDQQDLGRITISKSTQANSGVLLEILESADSQPLLASLWLKPSPTRLATVALLAARYEPIATAALGAMLRMKTLSALGGAVLPLLQACIAPKQCLSDSVCALLEGQDGSCRPLAKIITPIFGEWAQLDARQLHSLAALVRTFPHSVVNNKQVCKARAAIRELSFSGDELDLVLTKPRIDLALALAQVFMQRPQQVEICCLAVTRVAVLAKYENNSKTQEIREWMQCGLDALTGLCMNDDDVSTDNTETSSLSADEQFAIGDALAAAIAGCEDLGYSFAVIHLCANMLAQVSNKGAIAELTVLELLKHASIIAVLSCNSKRSEMKTTPEAAEVSLTILRLCVAACEHASPDDDHGGGDNNKHKLFMAIFRREIFVAVRVGYGATMSERDCLLRRMLLLFETKAGLDLASVGFTIGKAAQSLEASNGQVDLRPALADRLATRVVLSQVLTDNFDWVTGVDFGHSLGAKFPLYRSLTPESTLPYCLERCLREARANSECDSDVDEGSQNGEQRAPKRRRVSEHQSSTAPTDGGGDAETYNELFGEPEADGNDSDSVMDDGSNSEEDAADDSDSNSASALDSASKSSSESSSSRSRSGSEDEDQHGQVDIQVADVDELSVLIQSTGYMYESLDPSFWLPLVQQYFTLHALQAEIPPESGSCDESETNMKEDEDGTSRALGLFPARRLVENGLVGFLVWSLSSSCTCVRTSAGASLQLFGQLAARESVFRERDQVLLVLRALRGALIKPNTAVPPLIASFCEQALGVMLRPSHALFKPVNRFLLQRPWLNLSDVPLFYECFNSGSPDCRVECAWIVRVIAAGVRGVADVDILSRRHVCNAMMSFFAAKEAADLYMQQRVVDTFCSVSNVGEFGVRRLLRAGLIVWSITALRQVSSQLDAVVDTRRVRLAAGLCKLLQSTATSFTHDTNAEVLFACEAMLRFALPMARVSVTNAGCIETESEWDTDDTDDIVVNDGQMKKNTTAAKKKQQADNAALLVNSLLGALSAFAERGTLELHAEHLNTLISLVDNNIPLQIAVLKLVLRTKCTGLFCAKQWRAVVNWALDTVCAWSDSFENSDLPSQFVHELVQWLKNSAEQNPNTFGSEAICLKRLKALRVCRQRANCSNLLLAVRHLEAQLESS